MAMKVRNKKCPHCGKIYEPGAPVGATYYGSPVKTCRGCGKKFADREYVEIALEGIRPVDAKRITPAAIYAGICSVVIAGISLYLYFWLDDGVTSLVFGILFFVAAMVVFLSDTLGYARRMRTLEEDKQMSEARLSDPDYARQLRDLGYTIPGKYMVGKKGK